MFVALFPAGVPWAPEIHLHELDGPDWAAGALAFGSQARRRRPMDVALGGHTTAELHDAVHDQRRRAG